MKTLLKSEDIDKSWNGIPAIKRRTFVEPSLYDAFFKSLLWHIIGYVIIWAITFSLMFFGVTPKLFPMQKKIKDIEFVISNDSGTSASGGLQSQASTTQASAPANADVAAPSAEQSNKISKSTTNNSSSKSSDNSIPDFPMSMPSLKSLSSGLARPGKSNNSSTAESSSSIGDINSAFSSGKSTAAGSGFNKTATKKMITTYDISPYVNELKRNVRWNWKTPVGGENKRVELFLRIAKDGRLVILNVKKTSEAAEVDNAALNAVKKCLPLNPLPSKYGKNYLDVVFTFGSNSVGSRY